MVPEGIFEALPGLPWLREDMLDLNPPPSRLQHCLQFGSQEDILLPPVGAEKGGSMP